MDRKVHLCGYSKSKCFHLSHESLPLLLTPSSFGRGDCGHGGIVAAVKLPKRPLIGQNSMITLSGDTLHVIVIISRLPTRREFPRKYRLRIWSRPRSLYRLTLFQVAHSADLSLILVRTNHTLPILQVFLSSPSPPRCTTETQRTKKWRALL